MWFLDFLHMSFPRKQESISLINMGFHFRGNDRYAIFLYQIRFFNTPIGTAPMSSIIYFNLISILFLGEFPCE